MTTQALATFGVYGQPSDAELEVLALADDFRRELCEINQRQHNETIDIRDRVESAPAQGQTRCDSSLREATG